MASLVIELDGRDGFEARLRLSPVSIDEFFTVQSAFDDANWKDRASIEALCAALAPMVESWSEDRAPDAAGLAADIATTIALAGVWLREVRNVPAPLPRRSSDTAVSEDPSPAS